ncbi:MAG: four helix bundle protein [Chloroflexi bacterium]|nr:four helix bundle protein [Chloroflexota bacterium]
MTVMNLDRLDVWVNAKDFAVIIYRDVIPCLPADEKWNLASQLKRSAQSVPANIAEGHGRYHYLDNVRFCYMARGSLTETQSHISLAHELGFLPDDIYKRITDHAESIGKQLNNFIAYLKRSKQGEKDFPTEYTVREETENYVVNNLDESSDSH